MTALWLILGLLALVVVLLGSAAVSVASLRRAQPDMTVQENLEHSHYAELKDDILQGVSWLRDQPVRQLYVESYDGLRLHAQFVPHENAKGTVLLFHGYRSSWTIDFSISLPFYHALGYNLLVADQRAHGGSEGRFITFGVRERYDVLSWVTYLSQMLGEQYPMYLAGLSMGATTVLMASCFDFPGNVRGILADCGFTEPYAIIKHVLRRWMPGWIPKWMIGPVLAVTGLAARLIAGFGLREANTVDAVAHANYPVLFIHGKADTFVPCEMSQQAYAACTSEKELVLVENAEHGRSFLVDRPRVQAALEHFLESHLPKEETI